MGTTVSKTAAETSVQSTVPASKRAAWKDFVVATKPGIVRSNLLTAFTGLWLAKQEALAAGLVMSTLAGTALVVASGCVLNNLLDRDLDRYMKRTQNRPTVTGTLSPQMTLWYGFILGLAGLLLLAVFVHPLPALLGLLGLIVYVGLYTPLKRMSTLNTIVGAVSGAVPPLMGWSAVTGQLEPGAWILFLILFMWQLPHTLALAIRRAEEYRAAGFVMLPVTRSFEYTKHQILRYSAALVPVSLLLYVVGEVGFIYLTVATVLGLLWVVLSAAGFFAKDDIRWAKTNFFFSLFYLLLLNILMIFDAV
ncbi:heme o synthase [Bacillaceae bacterium]